jgi:SAM-dependent methyltransferase
VTRVRTPRNMVDRTEEAFRPPIFKPNTSARNRLENWLRRFLDVQAGSIWRDLRDELGQSHGSLIDIGCGAQLYRGLIPTHVIYHGIDTNDAKARFGYSVPDTHYFNGDDWGVEDGAFDTALCTEVLEHIQNPAAFLVRIFDCLRPGGRLVLTVPFAARWHFIPYDYWRFTPSGLHLLLARVGFDEVHVRARGNPLTVACYKIMALHLMLLVGADTTGPAKRAIGVLLLLVLGVLACIANASLRADWGDDCLGYTVTARRKVQRPQQEGQKKE